jgi:hypothetical protein
VPLLTAIADRLALILKLRPVDRVAVPVVIRAVARDRATRSVGHR